MRKPGLTLSSCSLFAMLATAAPALAQSDPLQELVVTARRKSELSQTVPVTITTLDTAALQNQQIRNVTDLQRVAPGLFTGQGSTRGPTAPVFSVRGQLNRDPALTNDASVAFYFDEMPWGRQQGANQDLVDVKSVQVLKGPQGTLFGRNSTGGAILVTPNAPDQEFGGYAQTGVGNFGRLTAEGVMNVPLSDQLAIRIVGNRVKRDGYMHAVNSGQDYNDINASSGRLALKWKPTSAFTSTTTVSAFSTHTAGDGKIVIQVSPPNRVASAFVQFNAGFVRELQFAQAHNGYEFNSAFSPDLSPLNLAPPKSTVQARTLTVQNNSSLELGDVGILGNVVVKNIAGFRRVKQLDMFETASTSFPAPIVLNQMAANQISEELQIQGTNGPLDYVTGLFFFRESGHDNVDGTNGFPTPFVLLTRNHIVNTSYSGFIHANYDLGGLVEGLRLSGGARLTFDRRQWKAMNRTPVQRGAITPATTFKCNLQPSLPANDGSLCDLPFSFKYHRPTWEVSVSYQAAPRVLVYGTVSTGYKSGGWSISTQTLAAATPYLPETVTNYEAGLKSDFRLLDIPTRLNLAAYYTDYKNVQRTVTIANPTGVLNRQINAASATIKGVELELTAIPLPGVEAGLSYAYLDPRYTKFDDIYRDPVSGINYTVDVSDSRFVLASKHSVSAYIRYELPVSESAGIPSVTLTYYYRSSFQGNSEINTSSCTVPGDPNPAAFYNNCLNRNGLMPGYSIVNLRADWKNVMSRGFDLSAFVTNLADNYYFWGSNNGLASVGTNSAYPGAPRMYGLEIRVPFGSPAR